MRELTREERTALRETGGWAKESAYVELTRDELLLLIQYIDFTEEFDDDPTFRDHADSGRPKLVAALDSLTKEKHEAESDGG